MNTKALLKNVKTTTLGICAGLMILVPQVKALVDDDPNTNVSYEQVVAGLGLMGVGIAAKDGDKTSEDVGTK